ncbi:SCO6745 family protein [Trujillonella humicola]|uniref:SCO6745 family protein n=1 Tax=Trujillonella humicola TaxID=3383699 RepID=UPI003905A150
MVSVDHPAPAPGAVGPALANRAHRAVEPLHNHLYFAPEQDEHLTAIGLRPGRMCYFAGRAAPLGAVGPGVVTATFHNFSPALVARHVPRAWMLAAPERVVAARFDAARASLTRLLGDAARGPEIEELAGLLSEACTALTPDGRPLYAGHADLPWPDEPLLQVWHGATLLREHRGDGHVAVLLRHGLSGIEALQTHSATGRDFTPAAAQALRGYTDEEWAAAAARLADRGLLVDGELTEAGERLRAEIEAGTDALALDPWTHLGAERTARVVELGKPLSARLLAAGAYPAGVFGR